MCVAWSGAMTTGRIVAYSPDEGTYALPAEHAASLTSDAGPDNLSHVMQFIPLLAGVEQEVVECFRQGEVCRTAPTSAFT